MHYYVVESKNMATTTMYKLSKFGKPLHEFNVMYNRNLEKFDCQCHLWNTHSISCSHIFCIMKCKNTKELPKNMILKIWTKATKSYHAPIMEQEEDINKMFLLCYSALCSTSIGISFLGAKNLCDFLSTRDEICRITSNLELKSCIMEIGSFSVPKDKISDPIMVKTKGAPSKHKKGKKEQRCSKCRLFGHTRRILAFWRWP